MKCVISELVQEDEAVSRIMMYYFRCILRGPLPFQIAKENPESLKDLPGLDPTAMLCLQRIVHMLEEKRTQREQVS